MGKKLKEVDKKGGVCYVFSFSGVCHDRCVYGADYGKKIKSVHIIDTGADCLRTAGRLWMGYA